MALTAGTKLGPYEILDPLGAGGMGEVYRARDSRLERTVAIKVLPSHLSSNPELKQRFLREARAISSLQHPHICTLHDVGSQDGVDFLVMEYLEGESLAVRLARGPLPTEQVLRHGMEIADGLDRAHRQGVVHRDLKPGNVVLTKSGAKLLDFGLAKPAPALATDSTPGLAPTRESPVSPITTQGMVVGTFQYMSPEQVTGREADPRSDIFALGAVLYEMATGKRAFDGKSQISVASAVLEKEPEPITAVQPSAPPSLDRIVRNCLAKDPEARYQSAHDVKLHLQWLLEGGVSSSALAAATPGRRWKLRERAAWVLAALFLVAALTLGTGYFQRVPRPPHASRFALPLVVMARSVAISPDGSQLVLVAPNEETGRTVIWLNQVGSLDVKAIPETEGAAHPFWSPDSQFLGFFADNKLKKLSLRDGSVQALANASAGRGGSWSPRGVIVYAPDAAGPLWKVSAGGGEPERITTMEQGLISHRWPEFLPDGNHFLYLQATFTTADNPLDAIWMAALDSKESKRVMQAVSNARYSRSGHLLLVRNRQLIALPFDASSGTVGGEATRLAEGVQYSASIYQGSFGVADNATAVYLTGTDLSLSQFVWVDRSGKELGTVGPVQSQSNPRLSPDGSRLLFDASDPAATNVDIYRYDLKRNVSQRMTFDPTEDAAAVWSPNGQKFVFRSSGNATLWVMSASGLEKAAEVIRVGEVADVVSNSWLPDGTVIASLQPPSGGYHLVTISMQGQTQHSLLSGPGDRINGQVSPDRKWLAYMSNESGTWEVYVTRYPEPQGKFQVSAGGGGDPHWRRDGKEIFYVDRKNTLFAVPVSAGEAFETGTPLRLFTTRGREPISSTDFYTYDVTADGQRFLVNRTARPASLSPVFVVLNWTSDLKK
ncbi:MAG: protein kinase domain-containing protein [Terriglobales bacterium]